MAAAAEGREYQRTYWHVVYDVRAAADDGAATITQAILGTVTANVNKLGAHLEVVVGYRDGHVEVLLQFQRKRSFVLRTRASDGSFEVKSLAHQGISAVTVTPPTVPCNRAHWDEHAPVRYAPRPVDHRRGQRAARYSAHARARPLPRLRFAGGLSRGRYRRGRREEERVVRLAQAEARRRLTYECLRHLVWLRALLTSACVAVYTAAVRQLPLAPRTGFRDLQV